MYLIGKHTFYRSSWTVWVTKSRSDSAPVVRSCSLQSPKGHASSWCCSEFGYPSIWETHVCVCTLQRPETPSLVLSGEISALLYQNLIQLKYTKIHMYFRSREVIFTVKQRLPVLWLQYFFISLIVLTTMYMHVMFASFLVSFKLFICVI